MPIVAMPDGTQVQFPDEMPKEQIRGLILQKFPDAGGQQQAAPAPAGGDTQPSPAFMDALAQIRARAPGAVSEASQPGMAEMSEMTTGFQKAPQEDTDRLVRANLEASKIQQMQGDKGILRQAAEQAGAGNLAGFADEAYSGTLGAGARMLRDGVGYGEAYKREQALLAAQKAKRNPIANVIGDIGGGLVLGSGLTTGGLTSGAGGVTAAMPSWGGLTLTGRGGSGLGKIAAGAGEGAAYGGVYGAGNASEGNRLEEAGKGAAIGGLTGGLLEGAGNAISWVASKSKLPVAPSIDELASATNDLYARSRAAGVTVNAPAFDHLANNMRLAAGQINEKLRPNTAGIVDDVMALKGRNVSLEELDELRQVVGQSMKRAQPQDVRTLTRMKTVIDHFADNVKPGDITGDIRGFDLIKEGRQLAARKAKAETIADLVETAKDGRSGVENGIVDGLRSLKKNKGRFNQFSKEEQRMITKIVRRASVHGGLRALGYLSPKSPLGAAIMGALGIGSGVVPAAIVAGTGMASRAAATALTRSKLGTLQNAVANGVVPKLPQLPNYLRPAISGATAGATGLLQ